MNATGEHIAMLNQKKLAIAVTTALAASFGAVSATQASETLFFPHVVGSATVASIVTVINSDSSTDSDTTNYPLHLALWSKQILPSEADTNKAICTETNVLRPTSANDIVTFDLFGKFGQANYGVLFEDDLVTENVKVGARGTWSIGKGLTAPRRGFLLVDQTQSDPDLGLDGEIFIFEFAAGATWGYEAFNNETYKDFDYSDAASESGKGVAIMPYDEMATAFLVTPTDLADQRKGNIKAGIFMSYDESDDYGTGIFDRDENPLSKTNGTEVTCVGRVDVQNLIFGNASLIDNEPFGGWGTLQIEAISGTKAVGSPTSASDTGSSGAVVFKIEYNISDTFNGETVPGVFNNATHILPPTSTTP
jgi:hypothetical protein